MNQSYDGDDIQEQRSGTFDLEIPLLFSCEMSSDLRLLEPLG